MKTDSTLHIEEPKRDFSSEFVVSVWKKASDTSFKYCKYLILNHLTVWIVCFSFDWCKRNPKGERPVCHFLKIFSFSFLIQRLHCSMLDYCTNSDDIFMDTVIHYNLVMVQSSVSLLYLHDCFAPHIVWLCLTFVNILACIVSKGISWKDTKIMGLFFFPLNFSCAKQYITSVQNSSGSVTSNAIL